MLKPPASQLSRPLDGFLACALLVISGAQVARGQSLQLPFLIGGYGDGIYLSRLDLSSGTMTTPEKLAAVHNPSFFCFHPTQDVVYVVTETGLEDAKNPPALTALRLDRSPWKMTSLGSQPIDGSSPCYVTTDPQGTLALVANYTSGNLVCFPINSDGGLEKATSLTQHPQPNSTRSDRQKEAHAHSILVDPSGKWVGAADLGLDQVRVYPLDPASRKLASTSSSELALPEGSGPRHFAFHPNGRLVFIINELASTLSSASWDSRQGRMQLIQTITTLPKDFQGRNSTAEVLVHPNGRFVYGSNRGHDSIAGFSVDPSSGQLTPIGHWSSGGKTPRNFQIDPSGSILLSENQSSHTIHSHRIDADTGTLTATGNSIPQTSPACIKFVPGFVADSKVLSFTLRRGPLEILLENPETSGAHAGTRFDHSGVMTSIRLGNHSLCSRWHDTPPNPKANDDIAGPCEEFGHSSPLGYEQAAAGQAFLKIGVGRLRKPDEPKYRFFHPYEVIEFGKWHVQADATSIRFEQSMAGEHGLAYRYVKRIDLLDKSSAERGWVIDHELTNTGSAAWSTDHYNHNFFLIDQDPIGGNYELAFPFAVQPHEPRERFEQLIDVVGSVLRFKGPLDQGSIFSELRGHGQRVTDNRFQFRHKPSGITIACASDAPLAKLNLWGVKKTLCPEPYVDIQLSPGQSRSWRWEYQVAGE